MSEEITETNVDENLEQLLQVLEKKDRNALQQMADRMEPIDFATLAEELDDNQLQELTELLDDEHLSALIEESQDEERIRIAQTLDNQRLLSAFGYMQKDDIVDMLGDFPIGRRKEVVNMMKAGDQRIITNLLQYPEDSAGGLMTTDYIALRRDRTIEECLDKIREIGPKTEIIETIFVIDEKRRLVGSCDLRDILSAPHHAFLGSIMDEHVISVQPETDQEETARIVSKYDLKALPVVSRSDQILGIITVDDIIDVIVDEYDEDILKMGGVSKEESLDTSLGESVRLRLPWLLINLLTAFLASWTVNAFENTISKVVALSAIMTIVSGMGGNAGSQTTSIMIRALAKEKLTFRQCIKPFCKEILLSIIDGAACGLATALVVIPMYHNFFLGVIVLIAMIGNLLVAGIGGFLIPLILDRHHADPAIASSIFLTTCTDVLGFFIFLGLATIFLPLLV